MISSRFYLREYRFLGPQLSPLGGEEDNEMYKTEEWIRGARGGMVVVVIEKLLQSSSRDKHSTRHVFVYPPFLFFRKNNNLIINSTIETKFSLIGSNLFEMIRSSIATLE